MRSIQANKLFALDRRLDRETDVLGQAFEDTARWHAARWFGVAARFVGTLPQADGRLTTAGAGRSGRLAVALEDTPAWSRFVAHALDQFADVSTITFDALKAGGHDPAPMTYQAKVAIGAYRTLKFAEFADLRGGLVSRAMAATRKAAASGQDVAELLVELREIFDEFPRKGRTLYESAIGEFSQVVTTVTAGTSGQRAYLYTGPVDQRIRPFCRRLVGRVLSRTAIDRLDNGQQPNSFLTRGGYNCRHQWRDVTNTPTLAALVDSATVVEPAAAQLATLPAHGRMRQRRRS